MPSVAFPFMTGTPLVDPPFCYLHNVLECPHIENAGVQGVDPVCCHQPYPCLLHKDGRKLTYTIDSSIDQLKESDIP